MKTQLLWLLAVLLLLPGRAAAQQHVGMQGLIHVPTAENDSAASARIGLHYVNQHMVPDAMKCDGEKFNTLTNYLSVTPFRWIQIGYGYTLWKLHKNLNPNRQTGFYSKDRYFSLCLTPLQEGDYWPAVAIGGNDVWGSSDEGVSGSNYYRNFYVAATKHFSLMGQTVGTHVAYRHWKRDYNHKWNGLVGGITVQPSFYKPLRFIGEWDGCEVNVGADCQVLRYFLVQASLQDFSHFSAGLCLRIGLL